MKRRIPHIFGVGLVVLYLAKPAAAFLGFGDVVFDPTLYAEAVKNLIQLEQQYEQLVRTYQMVRNQYDEALRMARTVPVDMRSRYRAPGTGWNTSSATNTFGTTVGWVNAINTGRDVSSGYFQSTQPLDSYGDALGNIPPDHLPQIKTSYATVELTDGANIAAIDTIGRIRNASSEMDTAIQGLEEDSLSSDADMNTQIAVLNKINAASLIGVRSAQDTNKLLVALVEQQTIDAKRKRDAEAQAIRNHIRFMTEGKAIMDAQSAGTTEAMRGWRMP